MKPVTLGTERLLLDAPTAADVDDVTRHCQDPFFETFLTLPWPYHRSDARFFVDEFVPDRWASGAEASWAIRQAGGGELLGVIGLRMATADVGFWIGAEHRGKGFVTEAVGAVCDWVFTHGIGDIRSIRWECLVGNLASAAVARKSGFSFAGTGPAAMVYRDGTRPDSWRGILHLDDDRLVKTGWPA